MRHSAFKQDGIDYHASADLTGQALISGSFMRTFLFTLFLLFILPSRRFFYRKSSLFTIPFSWSWLAFVGIVLMGATWIGLFSYKQVEYTNDLWWRFAYKGDAPRFLRSSLVLAVMVLSFCVYRLLRFFSENYLGRSRCAVIMQGTSILAFANLWETGSKEEMSIDLMRYPPDAPGGIMAYLFIQLMLWGRTQGYQWFNLGMSPLFGLEKHPLAPLWHKVGNAVFKYGDNFYNFEGLHAYKEKFDPVWQPRYLAAPALAASSVLLSITGMIAGSWKGVFVK